MSYVYTITDKLKKIIEKQDHKIKLLEEELKSANLALEERSIFAARLELDLENVIYQIQQRILKTDNCS